MLERQTPNQVLFVSLATAVLDKITVAGQVVAEDNIGGSAVFSALGARLFAPPNNSEKSPVVLKIHGGEDFPVNVEELLQRWNLILDLQRIPHTSSTRAEVAYHDTSLESRDFKYTTPVIATEPDDLAGSPILGSEIFHLFTVPQALYEQVAAIATLRDGAGLRMPLVIWEPRSKSYVPENLQHALEAAKLADIISPNHIEILELFGQPAAKPFDTSQIESLAQNLVDSGIGSDNKGIIVVRCAEHGALVLGRTVPAAWVPAYWRAPPRSQLACPTDEPSRQTPPCLHPQVVDTTGAGNCFLGGFAVGLLKSDGDPVIAAHYGSVAASFVVQQLGLPRLEMESEGSEEACGEDACAGEERWNGETVRSRLEKQLKLQLDSEQEMSISR